MTDTKKRMRSVPSGPLANWGPSPELSLRYLTFAGVYLDKVETLPPGRLAIDLLIQAVHWKRAACRDCDQLQLFIDVENRIHATARRVLSALRGGSL